MQQITTENKPCAVVILISGRGSNMQAIIEQLSVCSSLISIKAVISNRPQAKGLLVAANAGIYTAVVNHQDYPSREIFEQHLSAVIDSFQADLVVLAGFMRILGCAFVDKYSGRMLNIHPSLLPSFPGLDTHQRALDSGVKVHGCTVHFVTSDLDHGPIVSQAVVAVLPDDDAESLSERVLQAEHQLYPQAIKWFANKLLTINKMQVNIADCSYSSLAKFYPEISNEIKYR